MEAAASITAFVTVAASITKTLHGLFNDIRRAPDEILSMLFEIRGLWAVLLEMDRVSALAMSWCDADALTSIIDRANHIIREVERIVSDLVSQDENDEKLSFNRLAWLRKKGDCERLAQRIRKLEENASALLSCASLSMTLDMVLSMKKVSAFLKNTEMMQQETLLAVAENRAMTFDGFEAVTSCLKKLTVESSSEKSNESQASSASASTSTMFQAEQPLGELMQYNPSQKQKGSSLVPWTACKPECPCSCHRSWQITTPAYIAWLTGRLAVKQSGLFGQMFPCTSPDCERHESSTFSLQYAFPKWLLGRIIHVFSSNPGDPKIVLRMPRILSQDHPVFEFARSGDIVKLQDAFSTGLATPTVVTEHGESLLQYSVAHGHPATCRFLIKTGADPLIENKVFTTPGMEAWDYVLRAAFTDEVREEYKVIFEDTGNLDERGFTIVHEYVLGLREAASFRDAIVTYTDLIDVQDRKGRTPLHWATLRDDVDKVSDLLRLGANPGIHDRGWGNTPLDYAVRLKTGDCTKALLEGGADPNTRTTCKWTPLYGCGAYRKSPCEDGHTQSARHLIAWGADVTLKDEDGLDPLMKATRQDLPKLTTCLLDDGRMSVNTCDSNGTSAVSLAIIRSSHRVLPILLNRGADLTTENSHHQNLLHIVASSADPISIGILRKKSLYEPNPDAKDDNGQTPMDIARGRENLPPGGLSNIFDLLADIRCRRRAMEPPKEPKMARRDTTPSELEAGTAELEEEKEKVDVWMRNMSPTMQMPGQWVHSPSSTSESESNNGGEKTEGTKG